MSEGSTGFSGWLSRPVGGNPWSYATVVVGSVFCAVQVAHTVQMLAYGPVGVVLEGIVPLLFGVATALAGPWLSYRGYTRFEQRRIVVWMASVSVVTGLLFLWALSHQILVFDPSGTAPSGYGATSQSGPGSYGGGSQPGSDGYGGAEQSGLSGVFPHWLFVAFTNLTAGTLVGLVLGLYNVQSRRHYREAQRNQQRVEHQRARLSVLNRVLRHNLRNDANVILGNIRGIAGRADDELASRAEAAAEKTAELVALGEKARRIDETLGGELEYDDHVDLRAKAEAVADGLRRSETAVECSVDGADLSVTTNERVLTEVLEELANNAVKHAETEPVRLRIAVHQNAEGWTELVVEDDGPGLPPQEETSLDSGAETALEHASGLGLWLVQWGVVALGGEVRFEESEYGGTAVRVRLPETPADASPSRRNGAPTPTPGSSRIRLGGVGVSEPDQKTADTGGR